MVGDTYHLFHAQMIGGCGLGSWTSNSIVARSTSKNINGPYQFQEEVVSHFAHNPTIRKSSDGTYVMYFIGGWNTTASSCSSDTPPASETGSNLFSLRHNATCAAGAKVDARGTIRVGGDYKDLLLSLNATVKECISACCADDSCQGFSFNTPAKAGADAPGCAASAGHSCCKLKHTQPKPQPSSCPTCATGVVPSPPAPPPSCNVNYWPKSCGPNMPGPMGDLCGGGPGFNNGCGISMATSKSVFGPWDVKPLHIVDQWTSELMDCTHTNPTPYFLPNGTVVLAFNAGFCHNHLETIGIASAPHWSGPYTLLSKVPIMHFPAGSSSPHKSEDPFVWKTARGWHLLTHNQEGPMGVSACVPRCNTPLPFPPSCVASGMHDRDGPGSSIAFHLGQPLVLITPSVFRGATHQIVLFRMFTLH